MKQSCLRRYSHDNRGMLGVIAAILALIPHAIADRTLSIMSPYRLAPVVIVFQLCLSGSH